MLNLMVTDRRFHSQLVPGGKGKGHDSGPVLLYEMPLVVAGGLRANDRWCTSGKVVSKCI